ncbi:MAG: SGNH/GDSL hydrolase family protein [Candidatus Kariarchaeaceae archaeon]
MKPRDLFVVIVLTVSVLSVSMHALFGPGILTDTGSLNDRDMMEDTRDQPEVLRMNTMNHSFLALGDSYTIGESVGESERWPSQLVARLAEHDIQFNETKIIARTGWTTDELKDAIYREQIDSQINEPYDLVSLLIGVNNQFRGLDIEDYRTELDWLIQRAIRYADGNLSRVIIVTIPDYGVTPFGADYDRDKIAQEIDIYNSIKKELAESYGLAVFDITGISREAADNPDLTAEDGLHPSSLMYERWVDLIFPYVSSLFP